MQSYGLASPTSIWLSLQVSINGKCVTTCPVLPSEILWHIKGSLCNPDLLWPSLVGILRLLSPCSAGVAKCANILNPKCGHPQKRQVGTIYATWSIVLWNSTICRDVESPGHVHSKDKCCCVAFSQTWTAKEAPYVFLHMLETTLWPASASYLEGSNDRRLPKSIRL